jgi:pimeloyl-ACP methyl ester carboxylesterase
VVHPHEVIGGGPHKVVGLHGWLTDRTGFAPLWPNLDIGAFTYAFPDVRGYGEAMGMAGEYTLDEIAGDVLGLADDLGWDSFSVVGHSMGGIAAQQVMLAAPERVRAIVGVSPVPAAGVPLDDDGWALFSGAAEEPANRRVIIDMTTGGRLTGRWLDDMVHVSVHRSDKAAFAAYLPQWARTDISERVRGSSVPVKVIVGEHDPALSADFMRATWLEWYPNAELEVMANAGHYAPHETPVALATSIEEFLKR